jgi:alpha-glucoside transport system permease protein
VVAFSDRPEVQAVQTYLSSAEYVNVKAKIGNWVSAHKGMRSRTSPTRSPSLSVEILQDESAEFRFDASDLMPAAVGAGSFWQGMTEWINGRRPPTCWPRSSRPSRSPQARTARRPVRQPRLPDRAVHHPSAADRRGTVARSSVNENQPKLLMLMYGVLAFFAVVGILLLIVDRAPKRGREKVQLVAFLGPALVLLLVGLLIPAIRTFILSFKGPGSFEYVGLENYAWMLTNNGAQRILLNTAAWVLIAPILATCIGLLYAIVIDKARTEALAKALVFMPMAISLVGASIIWKLVYAVRPEGRRRSGWPTSCWSRSGWTRTASCRTPLEHRLPDRDHDLDPGRLRDGDPVGGHQGGVRDVIEAARLDGVNAWQMFRNVTLPSIRPPVVVVMVTISIATLKAFDIVRTTTGGQFNTGVVATEMYDQAFRFGEEGKGSALAVLLFVLVLPIVVYQVRVLRSRRRSGDHRCRPCRFTVGRRRRHPGRDDDDRPDQAQADVQRRLRHGARHRRAVDHPDRRPVHLLLPPGRADPHQRLVELLHQPLLHPAELRRGPVQPVGRSRPAGRLLHQLHRHHRPDGALRPGAGGLRGLRAGLDPLQGRGLGLHRHLRPADRPAADGAGATAPAVHARRDAR